MKLSTNKSSNAFKLPQIFAEKRFRSKKDQKGKKRRPILRVIGYSILGVVLITSLPILILRWVDPPTSSFMLQKSWQGDENFVLHYEWVDWDEISSELKIAVVAAEDQQFPFHSGFDFKSIKNALAARKKGQSSRGASTISQQVIKNLFLWPEPSWFRKGIEAYLSVIVEILWPKERILEVYLNIAQWGHNQFGAQAAAEKYFAKNASKLSRYEAALLAAVLPNPEIYLVDQPSEHVIRRQRWVLKQIRGLGGPGYLAEM